MPLYVEKQEILYQGQLFYVGQRVQVKYKYNYSKVWCEGEIIKLMVWNKPEYEAKVQTEKWPIQCGLARLVPLPPEQEMQ